MNSVKLTNLSVEPFEEASAADLAAAINTFMQGAGEALIVSVHYQVDAGVFSALLFYTI